MRIALIGHSDRVLGVGEAGRRLTETLVNLGYDVKDFYVPFGKSAHLEQPKGDEKFVTSNFDLVILAVNPDLLAPTLFRFGLAFDKTVPKVGFWSWEFDTTPAIWSRAGDLVDEVWTVSHFAQAAILRRLPNKPVHVAPLAPGKLASRASAPDLSDVGLAEGKFTVVCSFDFFSGFHRKNPIGAIEAFQKAFGKNSHVAQLVIKFINGGVEKDELAMLELAAKGDSSIYLLGGYMSADDYRGLLESADTYLSLHRCEGYGVNIVDALSLGVPVISTNYSGNLDFQNSTNSNLIAFERASGKIKYSVYTISTIWAEPSVLDAAAKLRLNMNNAANAKASRVEKARQFEAYFESISSPLRINLKVNIVSLVSGFRRPSSVIARAGFLVGRVKTFSVLIPQQLTGVLRYKSRDLFRRKVAVLFQRKMFHDKP